MRGASLRLEKGAVLKGSGYFKDYEETGYSHNEMGSVRSLLYSIDNSDITIDGEGAIDLNGDSFYDFANRAIPESKVPFSEKQIAECTATYENRPNQPIFFLRCKHVKLQSISISNAPSWTLSFVECTDVRVLDLSIDNNLSIPNCDGMHFSCSTDIQVRGCRISAGDDCIAFTCVTDWLKPCERAVVSDCILKSCSKAISIGYMHSIVRDIAVSNCVIYESNRAIALMSSAGTGLVENVLLGNLRLDTRIRAGNWWGNGEPVCLMGTYHNYDRYRDSPPARSYDACIRNVIIQNIICTGENAIAIIGENGSVEGVLIDHVSFSRKDSENLPLKGNIIDLSPGSQTAIMPESMNYWLFLKQVKSVKVTNARVPKFHGQKLGVYCEGCEDAVY
jgi:hypothetical protein